MRFLRALLLATFLLAPLPAFTLGTINPCPISAGFAFTFNLPCGASPGASGLTTYLSGTIFPELRLAFVGVAIVFFSAYAYRLLFEADEENTLTEVKNAYGYAITGAVIVCIATYLVDAFGTKAATVGHLINPDPIHKSLCNVITYFKLIVGVLVSLLITIQGIRMMLLQGQDSDMEQQRKRFFHGLLGVAVLLMANSFVAAIFPQSIATIFYGCSGTTIYNITSSPLNNGQSAILTDEVIGMINFTLEILAVLAVISIMVAGIMLVVSADESMKERAKKTISGTLITLCIVLTSYAIVNYFINL